MNSEFHANEVPGPERLTAIASSFERREFSPAETAKIRRTLRRSPRMEDAEATPSNTVPSLASSASTTLEAEPDSAQIADLAERGSCAPIGHRG